MFANMFKRPKTKMIGKFRINVSGKSRLVKYLNLARYMDPMMCIYIYPKKNNMTGWKNNHK